MRRVAIAVALAFAVTLAVVVGQRMSAEAMAVVVGVVCGVAAGIPMSVLLMLILTRRERQVEEPPYGQGGRHGAYPPVVVHPGWHAGAQWPPAAIPCACGGGVATGVPYRGRGVMNSDEFCSAQLTALSWR